MAGPAPCRLSGPLTGRKAREGAGVVCSGPPGCDLVAVTGAARYRGIALATYTYRTGHIVNQ